VGVKAAGAYGRNPLHLHVSIVLKSGSLNLLEPSGPVKACTGIALPLQDRLMYQYCILLCTDVCLRVVIYGSNMKKGLCLGQPKLRYNLCAYGDIVRS
jgi:hypothetical protein